MCYSYGKVAECPGLRKITIARLRRMFTLTSGTYEVFFAFYICISLIDCEKVNLRLGSVGAFFIRRRNDSAIFQSPRHERDFTLFASLLIGHVS